MVFSLSMTFAYRTRGVWAEVVSAGRGTVIWCASDWRRTPSGYTLGVWLSIITMF
ncbi:hypothetical protein I552_1245 [Mycobacterium xenopi 3993]|nr:hypothetical protein I552_1245 [Mycobacterium xenopi 3993]